MLISEQYIQVLKATHSTVEWGTSSLNYIDNIVGIIDEYEITTLVDYGAGQQNLEKQLPMKFPDLRIQSYDPGIPSISHAPSPAELLVCTDVLEHVEPECLDAVLQDLCRVMTKVGVFIISTRPAHQILSDGRNAHLIVENTDWWRQQIEQYFDVATQNDEFWKQNIRSVKTLRRQFDNLLIRAKNQYDNKKGITI
jgi:hypothetical protein